MGARLELYEEHKEGISTIVIQNGRHSLPYFRARDQGVFRSMMSEIKSDIVKQGAPKVYVRLYQCAKNHGCINYI